MAPNRATHHILWMAGDLLLDREEQIKEVFKQKVIKMLNETI